MPNRPKNLAYVNIDGGANLEWITSIDSPDLPENYVYEGRGLRVTRQGLLLERDYGTQHRFATYITKPSAITIVGGYTFFNTTNNTEYEIIVGYDSSNYFHVYVNDSTLASANPGTANNWIELTRVFTAQVNGTPTASATTVTIDTTLDSLQAAYTLDTNEVRYYCAWNVDQNNIAFITASTVTSLTSGAIFGSSGLAWLDNDNIILLRDVGWLGAFYTASPTNPPTAVSINKSQGTDPHLRWSAVEAQKKVNLYWGDSSSPPVVQSPLRLQRWATSRNFFNSGAGTYLVTLPANWYVERGGAGLITSFAEVGTAAAPVSSAYPTAATGVASITDTSGAFMEIDYSYGDNVTAPADGQYALRVAVTVVYDGYQESDPIFKIHVKSTNSSLYQPFFQITQLRVNLARMNKNITELRVYIASATKTRYDAGWPDTDSEYLYNEHYQIKDDISYLDHSSGSLWVVDAATDVEAVYRIQPSHAFMHDPNYKNATASARINLSASLGHAIDTTRSYKSSRYAVRLARQQGALSVIDGDDATLFLSSYDGSGVNNDDNFPDLVTDNNANRLKILLNGRGELMGLAVMNDVVYAFHKTEYETYDLQSGIQRMTPCDFTAKRSLVTTPYGIFWAGVKAIYWLPISGGDAIPISKNFNNWYDGTLGIDNGTSSMAYVTKSARDAVISGFDMTFQEVYFQILVNKETEFGGSTEYVSLRFGPQVQKWGIPRHFNIGAAVKYFSQSITDSNGSFLTLGYASGLLKYPVKSVASNSAYQDAIASAGTGGSAISTRLTMNVGSVYSLTKNIVLYDILVDHFADTTLAASAKFDIDLFANNEITSFHQLNQLLTDRAITRMLPPRGQLDRIRIRLTLPAASQLVGRWDVSKIAFGIVQQGRIGNI